MLRPSAILLHRQERFVRRCFRSNSTYDYLSASHRWKDRIRVGSRAVSDGTIVSLDTNAWQVMLDNLLSLPKLECQDVHSWLATHNDKKGVIHVPIAFRSDILKALPTNLGVLSDDVAPNNVKLLRLDDDAKLCEAGLLPRSKQAVGLANEPSDGNTYRVLPKDSLDFGALLMESYSFDRYKSKKKNSDGKQARLKLELPQQLDRETQALLSSMYWAQDFISTPACDMTPGALQRAVEQWVEAVSKQQAGNVEVETVLGEDLLTYNGTLDTDFGCGMIYAVGSGVANVTDRAPRLIRLRYTPTSSSSSSNQKVIAIVGKGVTYDTGGLNLKPGNSMLQMKKDMGGAANALGLFRALVETDFPQPLECFIPAVENVIGANAYRPGDVLTSVNGVTTEIGNTDAEGRLVLGDALALASALRPQCIVNFATLTGAARVALGAELPALFGNNPEHVQSVMEAARTERDPLWHMPMWENYRSRLTSEIADLRNISNDNGLGGAITAALYLSEFVVDPDIPFLHLDFIGIDPKGFGSAQGLRAFFRYLQNQANGK